MRNWLAIATEIRLNQNCGNLEKKMRFLINLAKSSTSKIVTCLDKNKYIRSIFYKSLKFSARKLKS